MTYGIFCKLQLHRIFHIKMLRFPKYIIYTTLIKILYPMCKLNTINVRETIIKLGEIQIYNFQPKLPLRRGLIQNLGWRSWLLGILKSTSASTLSSHAYIWLEYLKLFNKDHFTNVSEACLDELMECSDSIVKQCQCKPKCS